MVRFDLRPTSLRSGLHIVIAPYAGAHMGRPSSPGLVFTRKHSDCSLTQHGPLGTNQVPEQEGAFAQRVEVLCSLSRRVGPKKPMYHAHSSVSPWLKKRLSTCTTRITYRGSISMTTSPRNLAKAVKSRVKPPAPRNARGWTAIDELWFGRIAPRPAKPATGATGAP